MKKLLLLPLLITVLIASPRPSSAISIENVENTATRLAFAVVWGPTPSPPDNTGFFQSLYNTSIRAHNDPGGAIVTVTSLDSRPISALHVPLADSFSLNFSLGVDGSRIYESSDVVSFDGSQVLPLVGDRYGALFVYGIPHPTPDCGPSFILLCLSLTGMMAAKLRMRRA